MEVYFASSAHSPKEFNFYGWIITLLQKPLKPWRGVSGLCAQCVNKRIHLLCSKRATPTRLSSKDLRRSLLCLWSRMDLTWTLECQLSCFLFASLWAVLYLNYIMWFSSLIGLDAFDSLSELILFFAVQVLFYILSSLFSVYKEDQVDGTTQSTQYRARAV